MMGKRFAVGFFVGMGLFVGAAAVRAADDTVILKRVKEDTAVQNLVWDGRDVETLDARYRGFHGYAGGYRYGYRGYYGYGYYPRYYYPRVGVGFYAYPSYYYTPSVYYYSSPTYYIPVSEPASISTTTFSLNLAPRLAPAKTDQGPEMIPPPRPVKPSQPPETAPPPRPDPSVKPKPPVEPKDEGKLVKYKPAPAFAYRVYDEKPLEDRTIVINAADAKKR